MGIKLKKRRKNPSAVLYKCRWANLLAGIQRHFYDDFADRGRSVSCLDGRNVDISMVPSGADGLLW